MVEKRRGRLGPISPEMKIEKERYRAEGSAKTRHLSWLRENPTKTKLRDRLKRLCASARKASEAKKRTTRDTHSASVVSTITAWQASIHPEEIELVILLRMACQKGYVNEDGVLVGVSGGLPGSPLPSDPETVLRIGGIALALLSNRVFKGGRPATSVSGWTIHSAAITAGEENALERGALEAALEVAGLAPGLGETAARTATRLRKDGTLMRGPVGNKVAVVRRKSPKA